MGSYRAGETTSMTILKGKVKILDVTLGKRPTEKSLAQVGPKPSGWGVVLAEVSGFTQCCRPRTRRNENDPQTKLSEKLRVGDVILSVNGVAVSTSENFKYK